MAFVTPCTASVQTRRTRPYVALISTTVHIFDSHLEIKRIFIRWTPFIFSYSNVSFLFVTATVTARNIEIRRDADGDDENDRIHYVARRRVVK